MPVPSPILKLFPQSLGHDLPQLNGVVSEMTAKTKQVREHVDKLRHHILNEEHNPESGISLLELKLQLLMRQVLTKHTILL